METVFTIVGYIIYTVLALIALWGAYCVVMVWTRVGQQRFRSEEHQAEFLEALEEPLSRGDFEAAMLFCEGDRRAVSQLAFIAMQSRDDGFAKVRQMVMDRFQRDILADLEYRLAWVNTVIKSAPMVGLLGTVIGMMGAFGKLSTMENVQADALAQDIMVALITTASGLAIAIPLVMCITVINVRIRLLEDLCASGLSRFLEIIKPRITG